LMDVAGVYASRNLARIESLGDLEAVVLQL